MAVFLVPVKPGLCVIPLEKAVVLIGRQADCDVSLTQSRKVSRKHCCVAQVNNKIMVRDLGSTNGIYLNGQRVKKEGRVKLGDILMIGDLQFCLQTDPKPQHAANPQPAATEERKPQKKPAEKPAPQPLLATAKDPPSLDVPLALPDEGRDFIVEASTPKFPAVKVVTREDSGPLVPSLDLRRVETAGDQIPLNSDSL